MRDHGGVARQRRHHAQVSPLDAGQRGQQRDQNAAAGNGVHDGDRNDVDVDDDAAVGQEEQRRVRRESREASQVVLVYL